MTKWLMRNNPALLGDLLEERARGRSRAWYWRQVAVAALRSTVDEVRLHPVLTLRAVAVASAAYLAAWTASLFGYAGLFGYLLPPLGKIMCYLPPLTLIPSVLGGWTMARTHRACIEAAILIMIVLCPVIGKWASWADAPNIAGLLAGAALAEMRRNERSAQKGAG